MNPNAGWVHEVATGNDYTVTLNATVAHDAGTEVRASVERRIGNGYELALRTATPERTLDCEQVRTRPEMGVSRPTSYERLVVTMDGRAPVSARRTDTAADLYPLPNPIDATG